MYESRKRANKKWDSQNMKTLGVKLRKEIVEQFYEYARLNNTTAHKLVKDFVYEKVAEMENQNQEETE